MPASRRTLTLSVLSLACLLLGMALNEYGSAFFSEPAKSEQPASSEDQVRAHLEQAADAIAAAANLSVNGSASEEQAANRVQLSIEALRIIGLLGDPDAEAKVEKLLDELQAGSRPALAEAITQIRLSRNLRRWGQLDAAQQTKAVDRFVADVKASGATAALAESLIRLSEMLGQANNNDLAVKAINELLPVLRSTNQPTVQRMVPLLEGIVRRLSLVGNPIELEGTLLDGQQLDWDLYRGKVVLVDFFASWCGPCRAEVPNVLQNYRAYADKGFEVLGICLDDQRDLAESYRQQTGFDFPTLFSDDPNATGWNQAMARKYGITSIPRAILVDRDGNVVNLNARGPELADLLRELLGRPAVSADSSQGETSAAAAAPSGDLAPEVADVVPASALEDSSQPTLAPAVVPEN